jgi:hypothetical protein
MVNLDKTIADLAAIEADASLDEEMNLRARVAALDTIEFIQEIVRLRGRWDDLGALGARAAAQRQRLEQANGRLFERAQTRIRSGKHTPQEHRAWFAPFTDYTPRHLGQAHTGYDALDVLIEGTLRIHDAPQATREPESDMVHLEPTPARVVLELIDRLHLRPEDVFYDLGSGLGQVAILIHLLTGIQAVGVEIEPAYCEMARDRAWVLGLSGVKFVNEDARTAEYSRGSVFYLFTPFRGQMLQTVLDRLRQEAQARPAGAPSIRVCSYGPCTPAVARQPWLRPVGPGADHEFKVAIFRNQRS